MNKALGLWGWRDTLHYRPWNTAMCHRCQYTTGRGSTCVCWKQFANKSTQSTFTENRSEQLMETLPWTSLECSLTKWNRTVQNLRPMLFSNSESTDLCKWSLFCVTLSSKLSKTSHPSWPCCWNAYSLCGKQVKFQFFDENQSLNTSPIWHQNCFLCPFPLG